MWLLNIKKLTVPIIKVGRNKSYFTSDLLNGDNKYTANDICKMIEFLVDR